MFLVDEKMTTNPGLPTAVDFNNVLVNYIEIATEDLPSTRRHSSQTAAEKRESTQIDCPDAVPEEAAESGDESHEEDLEPLAEELHPGDFRQLYPTALYEMDLPEDDPRYRQATQVIGDSNGPPSLPMFLSRSILNGITPVKDDNSVLVLPNHTVLNHLMTSSVKNGVLATSVTTRYKKKVRIFWTFSGVLADGMQYVTTISFKPVPPPKPIPVRDRDGNLVHD
jgi:5'-AMP-activated protein kinase beta subunit, interaction domain